MKKLAVGATAAVLMAVIVAATLGFQLRAERERGRELAARVTALESAQSGQAPVPMAVPAPGMSAEPVSGPQDAPPGQAVADPATSLMTSTMVQGMLQSLYPDIAAEVGLTAEDARRFLALLEKQQGDIAADSMKLVTGSRDPAAQQELQRRLVEKEREHRSEQQAMLGNRYSQWEDYQSTAAARQQVNELRTSLGATGNPLSDAQVKALT